MQGPHLPLALRSWGKHFLVELAGFALRVHFMLFGSYRIDERKAAPPAPVPGLRARASSTSTPARCASSKARSTRSTTGAPTSCPTHWDPALARKQLRALPDTLVCDALLDQDVFAGVGNIIKNEVLFRIRVHPVSTVGALAARKLRELVRRRASTASTSSSGRRRSC